MSQYDSKIEPRGSKMEPKLLHHGALGTPIKPREIRKLTEGAGPDSEAAQQLGRGVDKELLGSPQQSPQPQREGGAPPLHVR